MWAMKSARIKILYLFVILHLPFLLAAGGEKKYPVSAIPAELKDDADAVIRTQQVIFELKNKKNALKKETYAITVLNKDGLKHTHFVQVYDKFRKIRRIEGRVYDADGNLVRKIKPDDIVDYSAN